MIFLTTYFCLMIEGSGSESRRPKNKWIRWIRIRNTEENPPLWGCNVSLLYLDLLRRLLFIPYPICERERDVYYTLLFLDFYFLSRNLRERCVYVLYLALLRLFLFVLCWGGGGGLREAAVQRGQRGFVLWARARGFVLWARVRGFVLGARAHLTRLLRGSPAASEGGEPQPFHQKFRNRTRPNFLL